MKIELFYVYSLSIDNNVFYIGCTKNTVQRYAAHVNSWKNHPYLIDKLNSGHIIKMEIIFCLPEPDAKRKEAEIIFLFSRSGHKILNQFWTSSRWWIDKQLPEVMTHKQFKKYLKYREERAIYNYCFNEQIEGWEDLNYPDFPFELPDITLNK